MPRTCEICRKQINEERAEALPETTLCLTHAREIEKYGGEFTLSTATETISKPGSLKKNYGGVSVSKTRNTEAIRRLQENYKK